jgi:hypothetical protein
MNKLKYEQPNSFKGCLITAFDTNEYSYTSLAVAAADRVVEHLNIPVTIVTDRAIDTHHSQLIVDRPQNNPRYPMGKPPSDWYNLIRTSLYDISPYDRTLVIDCDLMLATNNLKPYVDSTADFLIAGNIYDPMQGLPTYQLQVGTSQIAMTWATIMIFNKSEEAHAIFEMAMVVQNNYAYYSNLYGFLPSPIRNDYIFSIACHLIGGYGLKSYTINLPLINCNKQIEYKAWGSNQLTYQYVDDKIYLNKIKAVDLHLMNKDQI